MKCLLVLCCAAAALSGCAGLITPFINNPYAGDYNGTFTTSDGKAGPASIQLTKLGNVFGTLTDTATSQQGDLKGSVKSGLTFDGSVSFGSVSHKLSGTLNSKDTKLTGTVKSSDGYTLTVSIDSAKT